uniref:Uncharacterized protein n=1 Tax=Arundo donax TaxID=35708 RepID=A0A0A9ABN3_ARUDO
MTQARPKLKAWIEELNKIDTYAATWGDRRLQLAAMMKKFGVTSHLISALDSVQCSPGRSAVLLQTNQIRKTGLTSCFHCS